MTHDPAAPPPDSAVRVARSVAPFARPFLPSAAAVVVLGVVSSLLEGVGIGLFIPFVHSVDLEAFSAEGQGRVVEALASLFDAVPAERRLAVVVGAMLAVVVAKAAVGYGYGAAFGWLDARVNHRVRTSVFDRLLAADYGALERVDHGPLLNTLAGETWRTAEAVRLVVWAASAAVTTVLFASFLVALSWRLTLLTLVALGGIALVVRLLNGPVHRRAEQATAAKEQLTERMLDGVRAGVAIRTFGREAYERERFARASDLVSRTFYRLSLLSAVLGPAYQVLTAVLFVAVLLIGVRSAADLPVLFVFVAVLYRLQPMVQGLDGTRLGLVALGPVVRRVLDVLAMEGASPSGRLPARGVREGIRFEGVRFAYPSGGEPVLRGATFDVPAGRTTALVGPSGAGKTTVLKLLLRLYDPDAGRITVDGVPLGGLDVAAWRARLAIVDQDVYLFNASVRENIAYGREGATDAEVEAAARRAHADGFIRGLPEGYDTVLGDRGGRLSGGQRQRIALARAFVRDPDVVLLDEATNALDALTEHVVAEAIDEFGRDRTVLVIAHHLSTVARADHVVVLDGGGVVEAGPFEAVLEAGGVLSKMYRAQQPAVLS